MRYCTYCCGAIYGHNRQGAGNLTAVPRRRVLREHHALSRHRPLTHRTEHSDARQTLIQEHPPARPR